MLPSISELCVQNYGEAKGTNVSAYEVNAKDGATGSGAKGENNHWAWDFVAKQANYVQFFK